MWGETRGGSDATEGGPRRPARPLLLLDGLPGRSVRLGGRGRRGGVKDLSEASGALVRDEADLEGAGLALALVLLAVAVAEDVELDVLEPDAVAGLAVQPGRGGGLVGYWKGFSSLPSCRPGGEWDMNDIPNAVQTGHWRSSPSHTAAWRRRPFVARSR